MYFYSIMAFSHCHFSWHYCCRNSPPTQLSAYQSPSRISQAVFGIAVAWKVWLYGSFLFKKKKKKVMHCNPCNVFRCLFALKLKGQIEIAKIVVMLSQILSLLLWAFTVSHRIRIYLWWCGVADCNRFLLFDTALMDWHCDVLIQPNDSHLCVIFCQLGRKPAAAINIWHWAVNLTLTPRQFSSVIKLVNWRVMLAMIR